MMLDLDDSQAAAYVHLSMLGPSKASEAALAMGAQRTDAYRTLQTLVDKGFATASLERPVVFTACPPDEVFDRILATQSSRLDMIQKARAELAPVLATLRAQPPPASTKNAFRIVKGRVEIYHMMIRLMRDAQRSIVFVNTSPPGLATAVSAGLWGVAEDRAKGGLHVRALALGDDGDRDLIARSNYVEVREAAFPDVVRFMIVDDRELVLFVVNDTSNRLTAEEDAAIVTDSRDFVVNQSVFFETAWQAAAPTGVRIHQVDIGKR